MPELRLWCPSDQKSNNIFENIFGIEVSESEIIFPKLGLLMPVLRLRWMSDQKSNRILENIFFGTSIQTT